MVETRQALIIGATSSLAYALCQELAREKWNLVLCGRDKEELEKLSSDLAIRFGVSTSLIVADFSSAEFSGRAIIEQLPGHIDAAFLVSGDMGNPEAPDSLENITDVTYINYLIPAHLISLLTQSMEQYGKGDIIVISSVAGDRGRQSNYAYGSAKAALTVFCSGLRNKLTVSSSPVHIMTVKPGFVDTPLTYTLHSPLVAKRETVAKAIIASMNKRKNTIYVPYFWRFIMMIICLLPENIFKKLKL